jgi:hypothetical protein
MRSPLAIAMLAALLATPAWPQATAQDAQNPPNAPVVAPPPAAKPPVAKPSDDPQPYVDPPGVPACRQVCTPIACPAGQVCAPFCYQECM